MCAPSVSSTCAVQENFYESCNESDANRDPQEENIYESIDDVRQQQESMFNKTNLVCLNIVDNLLDYRLSATTSQH